jgi:hypothetical protein
VSCGVTDAASFWEKVKTNLDAKRIRLVFVADEISSGLRRIVEYLNPEMLNAEVLAVEVKKYVDDAGRETFVPRLLGNTEAANDAKGRSEAARKAMSSRTPAQRSEAARKAVETRKLREQLDS